MRRDAVGARELDQAGVIAAGRQARRHELAAGARDDVERLGADRAGGAEDDEPSSCPTHDGSGVLSGA